MLGHLPLSANALSATPNTTLATVTGSIAAKNNNDSAQLIYGFRLWDVNTVPGTPVATDPLPVNLGTKFKTAVTAKVIGIPFYQSVPGTYTVTLWDIGGASLASATITTTVGGWNTAYFATPVSILANTLYVASYYNNTAGGYAAQSGYFTTDYVHDGITAEASGTSGGNGVFTYGAGIAFPTSTFGNTSYFVDVVLILDVATGSTGTIAARNNNDKAALIGSVTLQGSVTARNTNDRSSLTGTLTVSGSVAARNTNDRAALTGALTVSGSLTALNANDSAAITGAVISGVSGAISALNNNDIASLSGQLTVAGALQARNTNDRAALSGALTVAGSGNARNANDSAIITGTVTSPGSTGSINAVNNNDSAALQGTGSDAPIPSTGGGSSYLPSQRAYSPSDLPSSKDKAQKQQREKLTLKAPEQVKARRKQTRAKVVGYDDLLELQAETQQAEHQLMLYLIEQEALIQQNEDDAIMAMIAELL